MTTSIIHPQFETQNSATRHLVILPTPHEDVLRLKEKLLTFQNRGWQVKDFGAFGAFEWGFILIEIEEFQGYHHFIAVRGTIEPLWGVNQRLFVGSIFLATAVREISAASLNKASNMSILNILFAASDVQVNQI